jgi:transketolase N-terminal domain/subunit
MSVQPITVSSRPTGQLDLSDVPQLQDIGFMTSMTLVLLGNYAQTGHFGGPLAYTPFNVATHLAGRDRGGLHFDYRRPKHPYCDKFMLAAGHCAPTCYALWMIMGEALARKYAATGDRRYYVAPDVAMLSIDALGFRRGAGALSTLLEDHGLASHPLFAQAKGRGIRALSGHIESTDVTNDVNGGPSGVGLATAAGKAAFWDFVGASSHSPKVIAFEGEFAMCAGHAQELKTQALAMQAGKRLRIFFSDNNAGIDDALIGGVIPEKLADGYVLRDQWTSYGWNVFTLADGHDYEQILGVLKTMEDWDPTDRRPMIVIGKTTKGHWPAKVEKQIVGYQSHPYGFKMNADYIVGLAKTYETRYGVKFEGMTAGPVTDTRERLIQFKTNIDIAMSVLDKNGLGDWLADRLVEIGDRVVDKVSLRVDPTRDPFLDERLKVASLPAEPQELTVKNPTSGATKVVKVALFRKAGDAAGARRAISEIIKWLNYVTDNRVLTAAADLSESVNLEHGSIWGHYDPETNPHGTRLKAAIQEAGNVSTAIGLVSQNASVDPDKFAGVWAFSGTYGAFTPLMYLPARVWSQQNQDSKFKTGVLHILSAHSGPETAADARTHFGIFSPQVWKLFPRGQIINLSFWDYNDVAPGYFAAAEIAAREKKVGHHCDRGCEARSARRRSQHVRRPRRARGGQRAVRDPRLRAGRPARLRRLPRRVRDVQHRQGTAEARAGRHQRQGDCRSQRGAVRPPARDVPPLRAARRREAGLDVRDRRHSPSLAAAQRRRASRRLLSHGRLGQPVADRRARARRDCRGTARSGLGFRGHQALRRCPYRAARGTARRAGVAALATSASLR